MEGTKVCCTVDRHRRSPASRPLGPFAQTAVVGNADLVCLVFFTLEAVAMVIVLGIAPYLRDGWNLMDALIVVVGLCCHPCALGGSAAGRVYESAMAS